MILPKDFVPLKTVLIVLALFFTLGTGYAADPQDNTLFHSLEASIMVADPEAAAESIVSWAEDVGGYFLVRADDMVIVRFPFTEMGDMRALLEELAEEINYVSPEATDLQESLLGLQSGIRSREEILQRNLAYLDNADVKGTLAIEKEINSLLQQIEGLKGRLQKLNVDRMYSWAEIYLNTLEQSIPEDIPSSFDWINGVSFFDFIREEL